MALRAAHVPDLPTIIASQQRSSEDQGSLLCRTVWRRVVLCEAIALQTRSWCTQIRCKSGTGSETVEADKNGMERPRQKSVNLKEALAVLEQAIF